LVSCSIATIGTSILGSGWFLLVWLVVLLSVILHQAVIFFLTPFVRILFLDWVCFIIFGSTLCLLFSEDSLDSFFIVSCDVVGDNANEVCKEAVSNKGNVGRENNLLLSGGMGESNSIISSDDLLVLVEEPEIYCVPNSA
jgi:hypothetical protein